MTPLYARLKKDIPTLCGIWKAGKIVQVKSVSLIDNGRTMMGLNDVADSIEFIESGGDLLHDQQVGTPLGGEAPYPLGSNPVREGREITITTIETPIETETKSPPDPSPAPSPQRDMGVLAGFDLDLDI